MTWRPSHKVAQGSSAQDKNGHPDLAIAGAPTSVSPGASATALPFPGRAVRLRKPVCCTGAALVRTWKSFTLRVILPLKNRQRMRYDAYLRVGYLIAIGVIAGACRHLIKDRMERAGMYWTRDGAQAMLDLRSVWISGHGEAFQKERIERQAACLYPHRDLVAGEAFFAMAV
jgi:hypothetical protein